MLDRAQQVVGDPAGVERRGGSRSTVVAQDRSVAPVIQTRRRYGAAGRKRCGIGRLGQAGHAGLEHLEHVVSEHRRRREQRVDVTDAQDRADLGGAVRRRQRHHQRADAARREPRDHPVLAVREEQADARCPCPIPAASMPPATRRGRGIRVGVGHAPVGGHDEVAVAPVLDRVAQHLGDGRRKRIGRRVHARPAGFNRRRRCGPPAPRLRRGAGARARARSSSRRYARPRGIRMWKSPRIARCEPVSVGVIATVASPFTRPASSSAENAIAPTPVVTSSRSSCTQVSWRLPTIRLRERIDLADVLVAQAQHTPRCRRPRGRRRWARSGPGARAVIGSRDRSSAHRHAREVRSKSLRPGSAPQESVRLWRVLDVGHALRSRHRPATHPLVGGRGTRPFRRRARLRRRVGLRPFPADVRRRTG